DDVRASIKKMGIVIAGGQDHLKGKIFRIGTMGAVSAPEILATLAQPSTASERPVTRSKATVSKQQLRCWDEGRCSRHHLLTRQHGSDRHGRAQKARERGDRTGDCARDKRPAGRMQETD